jgi:excinuclease ABC subunit A
VVLSDIVIKGASEHNLQSLDVDHPAPRLTTITGVSGSGKSSLAFDTSGRRPAALRGEPLLVARAVPGRMEKPRSSASTGSRPRLLIDQKTVNRNPRSTVGTITEIHDHLRLLYARLGQPRCPVCGAPVSGQTPDAIVASILPQRAGQRVAVLSPVVRDRKGEYRKDLEGWRLKGFTARGSTGRSGASTSRQTSSATCGTRSSWSWTASRWKASAATGWPRPWRPPRPWPTAWWWCAARTAHRRLLHREHVPRGPRGLPGARATAVLVQLAARRLPGLRRPRRAAPARPAQDRARREALHPRRRAVRHGRARLPALRAAGEEEPGRAGSRIRRGPRRALARAAGARQAPAPARQRDKEVTLEWAWTSADGQTTIRGKDTKPFEGLVPAIARCAEQPGYPGLDKFLSTIACAECEGTRLNPAARAVLFRDRRITDISALTVEQATEFLRDLHALAARGGHRADAAARAAPAAGVPGPGGPRVPAPGSRRAHAVGRREPARAPGQPGGQRAAGRAVRAGRAVHRPAPARQRRLIDTLHALRDRGNTVLVVEHDEETIRASDAIVDIGPGRRAAGRRLLAAGPAARGPRRPPRRRPTSSRRRRIEMPDARRPGSGRALTVVAPRQFNLKDLTVRIPLGCLVAVTGVSGSGKSTLVDNVLRARAGAAPARRAGRPGEHDALQGIEHLDKVVEIDQAPIGRTPRSNPATYTGLMDLVRDSSPACPRRKVRGYARAASPFNVAAAAARTCLGAGVNTIEMQFLADVEVPARLRRAPLQRRDARDPVPRRAIDEVLAMTVDEACVFFEHHKRCARARHAARRRPGLRAAGPAQHDALGRRGAARQAGQRAVPPATGRTLYILDEPTTGLHFEDVRVLLARCRSWWTPATRCWSSSTTWTWSRWPTGSSTWGRRAGRGRQSGRRGHARAGGAREGLAHGQGARARARPAARAPAPPPRAAAAVAGRDLELRGASLHNLQSVDVTVPHGRLTVVTGPSGSGKTSLAFDTIFAEGQRRFVESLSTYARRFLERMDRPPLESISGLAPAIAIDQKTAEPQPAQHGGHDHGDPRLPAPALTRAWGIRTAGRAAASCARGARRWRRRTCSRARAAKPSW